MNQGSNKTYEKKNSNRRNRCTYRINNVINTMLSLCAAMFLCRVNCYRREFIDACKSIAKTQLG